MNYDLDYIYPNSKLQHHYSFILPRGARAALLGENAAGKTSLLLLIAGLLGDKTPRHKTALMFQQHNFFEHLSMQENFNLTQNNLGLDLYLKTLGLTHILKKKPNELSMGELQKSALILNLLLEPEILLLDEPTTALDPLTRDKFLEFILTSLTKEQSLIMSTHNLADLAYLSWIIFVKAQKIYYSGSKTEFLQSKDPNLLAYITRLKEEAL